MIKVHGKHRGGIALLGAAIAGGLAYVGYRERYAFGLGVKAGDNVLVTASSLTSVDGSQLVGISPSAEVIVNVTNAKAAWTLAGVKLQGKVLGMAASQPGIRPPAGMQPLPAVQVYFTGAHVLDVQPAGTTTWKV